MTIVDQIQASLGVKEGNIHLSFALSNGNSIFRSMKRRHRSISLDLDMIRRRASFTISTNSACDGREANSWSGDMD